MIPTDPVLVVDDDANFLELLASALEHDGFTCLKALTAEQALAYCESETPCAAVLDGLLPGMRGDELARTLRKRWDSRTLPILFVSSFFRDLRSYRYLRTECGVDAVLHKPMPPEDVSATLCRLLGNEPKRSGSAAATGEGGEPFASDVARLLPEYLSASRQRVAAMRSSLGKPEGVRTEARETLRTEAHRLRGSGNAFGLPEISRLAGQIEDLVAPTQPALSPAAEAKLSGLVEALGEKIARAAGERPILVEPFDPTALRIGLVDGASELAASCRVAAATGRHLRVFTSAAEALRACQEAPSAPGERAAGRPDVLFVAGDRPELDGREVCGRLLAEGVQPLVLISADDSVAARVAAVQAGIAGMVARPPDAEGLFSLAGELARRRSGANVLALDEDPGYLEVLSGLLAHERIALQPCLAADELFDTLERTESIGVLVGINVTSHPRLDLVRALRADPLYLQLPVIVLSREVDAAGRRRALEAGADDVLCESEAGEALAARVRTLVDRRAQQQRERLRDPVTGAFLRPYLLEAAERSLALARRAGRVLALLVFDFDAERLREAHGRPACSQLASALASQLRAAFRTTDLVARIGPGRFAVLLHDVTGADARGLLDEQLELFARKRRERQPEVALRGALASFPGVSGGAQALVHAAEEGLLEPRPGHSG